MPKPDASVAGHTPAEARLSTPTGAGRLTVSNPAHPATGNLPGFAALPSVEWFPRGSRNHSAHERAPTLTLFFKHMKFQSIINVTALCAVASAQDIHQHIHQEIARPSGHAPISIMGDHAHSAGGGMLSYRYMFMDMDGIYRSSSSISSAGVFANNYAVAPERMTMDMHMIGAMYAPTDRITLTAMLPYTSREMDHSIFAGAAPLIAANGGSSTFTTESGGIGDLKLGSLISIAHEGGHHFHGSFGVSLPTGSIAERDLVPGPGGLLQRQLPAAMQPGSGTFDLLPSLTYTYLGDSWSAGVQAAGVIRTGRNAHGYTLGDSFDLTSWVSCQVAEWASVSTGLSYRWDGELDGNQSDLMLLVPGTTRRTVPTAFGENYGGSRIEALAGVNFVIPGGALLNHRIAADIRVPLWQDRNGISLGADYTLTLGWQYAF